MTIKIHGKEYLEVKDRVAWFRKECPHWSINTDIVNINEKDGTIIIKATVSDETGRIMGAGHAHEFRDDPSSMVNKYSHVENCETSAIGRALASIGYGIDDSYASANEIEIANNKKSRTEKKEKIQPDTDFEGDWQNAIIPIGKNKGKKLGELSAKQRQWYLEDYEANEDYPDSLAFRKACDNCIEETNSKSLDFAIEPPSTKPEPESETDLDEDVPF